MDLANLCMKPADGVIESAIADVLTPAAQLASEERFSPSASLEIEREALRIAARPKHRKPNQRKYRGLSPLCDDDIPPHERPPSVKWKRLCTRRQLLKYRAWVASQTSTDTRTVSKLQSRGPEPLELLSTLRGELASIIDDVKEMNNTINAKALHDLGRHTPQTTGNNPDLTVGDRALASLNAIVSILDSYKGPDSITAGAGKQSSAA